MHIIAIDCGASFIKFALFDNKKLLRVIQTQAPPVEKDSGIFSTRKIDKLVGIVKNTIKDLSLNIDEAIICIDNEMHGFILAKEDGTLYTDYISWQTELLSVDIVCSYLNRTIGAEKSSNYIRMTGMPLRAGLPSSTLLWMKKNGYLKSESKLYFYTLGDYIIKSLTGIEPICHPTNAAATGLYDLVNGVWNWDYISTLTGNSGIVFPVIGKEMTDCLINGKCYHILPAIGDQQAALIGSGFQSTGTLSFNMGTGAQVSRLVKKIKYGDCQIRPYFYNMYLKTVPHIPSGRAINVYFRFIKDICRRVDKNISDERIWEILQEAVAEPDNCSEGIICDLSFFENAASDHAVGSISNITEYGFTLNVLLQGVFSQLAKNFIGVADRVNNGLPIFDSVIFSGGLAQRWENLRNIIIDGIHADENKVTLSVNDTLYGCMLYAQMDREDR